MTLPLLYTNPVPVDRVRHKGMALALESGLAFAAKITAVPIALSEFSRVMQHYPIAFSMDKTAAPLAILGLRAEENLFVQPDSKWLADTYIPAYIRRYPFIFAENGVDNMLTLCVDDVPGVLKKSAKDGLFDKDGSLLDKTKNTLEFCGNVQRDLEKTTNFTTILDQSGILGNCEARVTLPDHNRRILSGLRVIDKRRYDALSEATLLEWHRNQWTPAVYAHLYSMGNWGKLTRLLDRRLAG